MEVHDALEFDQKITAKSELTTVYRTKGGGSEITYKVHHFMSWKMM